MREPEAGELTHRMQVRRRVDRPVGVELAPELTPVCKRWVKVEPLGTATYTNAQQTDSKVTHRLYCRFVRDLDSACEFVERGRVFRVHRPTAMRGRNIWSVIEVEELGPDVPAPNTEGGDDGQLGFG
ncbi:head-tail adaptor protein [Pseudomonas mosselii]|uniref:head-tail adaptor protein n=1 Tax=Pseudomonas mosselii TaxID=78327 RepID=UPI003F90FE8B